MLTSKPAPCHFPALYIQYMQALFFCSSIQQLGIVLSEFCSTSVHSFALVSGLPGAVRVRGTAVHELICMHCHFHDTMITS